MPIDNLLDLKALNNKPKELQSLLNNLFINGKNIRSKIISIISKYLSLKKSEELFLCRVVEYIHSSSLLHDDVIDGSLVRRNQMTTWLKFSTDKAVLAGDYLLSQAGLYLVKTKNIPLLEMSLQSIMDLVEGEFLQKELIRNKKESLKNIDKVSDLKTGSLFRFSLKAPFLYKDYSDKNLYRTLDQIGYYFGILFQRADDLLDFFYSE